MVASREERSYRSSNKKCVRGEARDRLLEELIRKKTGLKDVEELIIRERKKNQGEGGENTYNSKIRKYEEERKTVEFLMRKKLRENRRHCIRLRREKFVADRRLREHLGGKTRVYKQIVKDTRKNCEALREEIKNKNKNKIEWLEDKYGWKYDITDELTEHERDKYGGCEILSSTCSMRGEELRQPEIVLGKNEILSMSEEEKS